LGVGQDESSAPKFDREQWMKVFDSLPKERKELLSHWFQTQILIMDNLGVPEDEWFALIGWALDNPDDFSFIDAFPETTASGDAKSGEDKEKAAALRTVGGKEDKSVATGPGIKEKATAQGIDRELYQRFMANRMNERPMGGTPKKKPPKPGR
jgi:hypothetical protein